MSTPRKAAPETWAEVEKFGQNPNDLASCIIELRDRLAAAEQRIQSLVDASPAKPDSFPAPAITLVEWVGNCIPPLPDGRIDNGSTRAAILACASWLERHFDGPSVLSDALRSEAKRDQVNN